MPVRLPFVFAIESILIPEVCGCVGYRGCDGSAPLIIMSLYLLYDYGHVLRDWGGRGNVSGSRGNICLTEFNSLGSEEFQQCKATRD